MARVAAGTAKPSTGSYLKDVFGAADRQELLEWLAAQPVLRVESDVVVVHGGLHPRWSDLERLADEINAAVDTHVRGREDSRIDFATFVRHCDARGNRPSVDDPSPDPPFEPWDRFYTGPRTVVWGHWARRGLIERSRLRGLDTGCVYGGPLTAWIAEEDRIVQVAGWRGA